MITQHRVVTQHHPTLLLAPTEDRLAHWFFPQVAAADDFMGMQVRVSARGTLARVWGGVSDVRYGRAARGWGRDRVGRADALVGLEL